MSNAEHLIENAIYAMKDGQDVLQVLDYPLNRIMLEQCGMKKTDVYAMAQHVVFSLYNGNFPE